MSFFIRNSKRKINGYVGKDKSKKLASNSKKKFKKNEVQDDESIASSDEEFAEERAQNLSYKSDTEEEEETAQEKRLRLARKRLEEIEEEERDRAEFEQGAVARRLHEEYLEEKGRLRKVIASTYTGHEEPFVLSHKHHKDPITCLCVSNDGQFLYSGSKDGTLVKWSVLDKAKIKVLKGKQKDKSGMKCIRCIAISTDSKFLTVGENSTKDIHVLSANDMSHIKNLQGHRDIVTGLVFRKNTHTLYSASEDRSVKVWNLDDMAYVETLYGHQSGITSIDALSRERAITSGGSDGSIRVWKIAEESQLIFHGHRGNIDMVKLINEENFFSCGDDGQLCLWGSLKKKPLCTVKDAHGTDDVNNDALWISSIATFLNTDLVASGSSNGMIKLWKCADNFRNLVPLFDIKITGFVNSLAFTPDGNHLIAGVGKEHRLGRWSRIPEAKNTVVIVPLIHDQSNK